MVRMERNVGLLLSAFVLGVLAWSGQAAEEKKEVPKGQPIMAYPKPGEGIYYLPAPYWGLSRPEIQKELELLPEQIEKLKELSKRYWEQQQELYKGMNWGAMTPEERTAKWKEVSERMRGQQEELRKEIEKILMPAQAANLRDIHFRQYATGYLWSPQVVEKIGLTAEQKEQLTKLRQEYQEKQMQLMRELVEKQLNVLTPEQKEKLKEEVQKTMRF